MSLGSILRQSNPMSQSLRESVAMCEDLKKNRLSEEYICSSKEVLERFIRDFAKNAER